DKYNGVNTLATLTNFLTSSKSNIMASEHETKSSNGSNSPYSDLGASDLLEKIPQQPCVSAVLDPRAWFDPSKLHPTGE
ncbi:hypothetical protein Ocin01_02412, partial [Orchesella cincta]